jgi:2-deoxy-D-gluconate 3-dehydrogenase
MFDLGGKVAVVTGGNGGIGLGMARGLAQAGALVVIAGRNAAKSAQAVQQLKAEGLRADALEADVTDEASVTALFYQVAARHARVDILVNNAGTTVRKMPQDLSLADWHQVMDTNLTSAFLCARAAHPHLQRVTSGLPRSTRAARRWAFDAALPMSTVQVAGLSGFPWHG